MDRNTYIRSLVEKAFIKLKASLYYEKNNLQLRQQMVEFCVGDVNQKLEVLAERLSSNENFEEELDQIDLFILPKKVKSDKPEDDNILINSFDYDKNVVERLMLYANIPMELHIVAVLWVMLFGKELDKRLNQYCWGNRLIIDEDTNEIKDGRHLFKPYIKQYQQWWSKAIVEANHLLDNGENVCILNLDIQNYYHSIRIPLQVDSMVGEGRTLNDFEKTVWQLFVKIHESYNAVFKKYGFRNDDIKEGFALPVGLLSSPILANYYLREFDQKVSEELMPAYYGRYVDDILIVLKSSKRPESLKVFLNGLNLGFKQVEKEKESETKWQFDENPKLQLQQEKIFLYYFDHKFSTELLSKFEKEQKEHSSEYRFLSDEEDERFSDELFDFESCFDQMEKSKARFKPQSENKYKLACYLSKFVKRRIQKGKNYGKEKEKQLNKFFQGSHLIKYYFFWEKLFSLYVVSEDHNSFLKLEKQIKKQIEKLNVDGSIEWEKVDGKAIERKVKEQMSLYLIIAMKMAVTLGTEKFAKTIEEKCKDVNKTDSYRGCHYVRKSHFSKVLQDFYEDELYKLNDAERYLPYNIRLWELMYALTYNYLHNDGTKDYGLDLGCLFEEACRCYNSYNGFDVEKDCTIRIQPSSDEKHKNQKLWEVIVTSYSDEANELGKIRIVPVNIRKHDAAIKDSRRGKRKVGSMETETLLSLLDSIGLIKGRDIFVMPELSLPTATLSQFVDYSANQEIAFVAGLEYLNVKGVVYNVELTCLPIEINHVKDCVLIPRIKNHYSPDETAIIVKESFVIPKCSEPNTTPSYLVCQWRGLFFTTFNCFELTNSPDRSSFVGDVDLLIAITHNKDLSYFDNIAETTCRDLHCYVVVDNVGQYGDTQVVCPKKRDEKFLAKIKGSTTEDNPFTLTIADMDIKGLREFQKYGSGDFKPLPAGYHGDCKRLKDS